MFPVSVKGVLVTSDGKVVLVLNDRGEWELPGGRIELGESAEDCLAREIEEAAGVKAGDQIIQIEKQNVAGRRAMELVPFMKLKPGETRTFRLKHADGTEADARITKPKT
jgi:8-oxo-dGTP pyrophosphatase MutT (NUDIX family)